MKSLLASVLALLGVSLCAADDHAVVLLYHHVSENTPATTSVAPAVLDKHLDYLQQNGFGVWPLERLLNAIERGEDIPANTVAITFDDAYSSVYSEAFPRLRKRGWPFTLFVNSEAIDRGYRNYMTWDQIRELAAAGMEVANHSHSHAHLVRRLAGETDPEWRQRISADIRLGAERLYAETGVKNRLFAYPYGEYSPEVQEIVKSMGYYGIAQQSGAVGRVSDFLALPRFPMSTGYADLKRFALSVQARPLAVTEAVPRFATTPDRRLEKLRLTLGDGDYRASQLACYSASGERLSMEEQGVKPTRIALTLHRAQSTGRHKINCTAPASGEPGAFYWYSYQWLVRHKDGSWYRE